MKEFQGKLEKIAPSKIIDSGVGNDLDNFFLVFGLIYNDLKGLLFFSRILENEYKPDMEKVSVQVGEYAGMQTQVNRLVVSLVSEFLIFIKKNKSVINSPRFMLIERGLPKNVQLTWRDICSTAINPENSSKESFFSRIARVRSSITFHYDHSGTQLRSGYIRKFFETPKDDSNKSAYYSFGDSMPSTRFYYCDGSVSEYLKEHLMSGDIDFFADSVKLVDDMNQAMFFLMREYIEYKKSK